MNSDKSQEEVKAMTFEDWDLTHEYKSESVYGAAFDGWHARDAEVLALVAALKKAKEALEAVDQYCAGKDVFEPSLAYSTEKALSAITPLLKEKENTKGD